MEMRRKKMSSGPDDGAVASAAADEAASGAVPKPADAGAAQYKACDWGVATAQKSRLNEAAFAAKKLAMMPTGYRTAAGIVIEDCSSCEHRSGFLQAS